MMIRGDQHVDDWAEVAVDYLDGQLDQDTRLAVEAHLSGCPDCAARLRKQQYVVRFLQESVLDDPPQDLEYRSMGEMIFPSPGGETIARPAEVKKPARTPRWYRELRAWAIPVVAFVALVGAVVGYSVARSGSDATIATSADRVVAGTATTAAASATTAAPSEASAAGAIQTMTTAGATTTTALLTATPSTDATFSTLAATQDPKAMVRALETAQAPSFVSFQTAAATPPVDDQGTTGTLAPTGTTAADGTETTVPGTPTTAGAPDTTIAAGAGTTTDGTVSADQAAALLNEIKQFTGLEPVDQSLWLGGPTFAVFLPREDAAELVDLVRSISSSFGLTVSLEGTPPAQDQQASTRLLEHKDSFPVLAAQRALQPSTLNYDFTTSTLGPGSAKALPDGAGTHVIVIIWIAQ
jgi:anti-sigma factor RsiW